jgi:DNA-binding response OmpR family regulator
MKNKQKILVACDEGITLDFFSLTLSKLGFDVEEAQNGVEALEKIKAQPPDLVLTEALLPGLSGWALLGELKKQPGLAQIPVIFLSDMSNVKDKVEAFEQGAVDYITKPFNFSEVLARVRAVLRIAEMFSKLRQSLSFHGELRHYVDEIRSHVGDKDAILGILYEIDKGLD